MKKLSLKLSLIALLGSTCLNAQVVSTETFEGYTSGKPTSFTNNSQTFTLTSANCAAGGMFGVFIPGQSYSPCGSGSSTSTGTGYGVGTGCASASACGSVSDKFIDNGFANGTSQIYSIKTSNAAVFNIRSVYVYISNDHAATAATSAVTFRGKKAGATVFTHNPGTLSINTNGFTYIDFVAAGYGSSNIDELEIQGGASTNYVAIDNFCWSTLAPLAATATFTNTSCNGLSNGRARVTATGGVSPYTYSWAPSGGTAALATGLAAGTYTCTITDAVSASVTATVTVGQPSAISAVITSTNVTCNGGVNGIASVSASGGTPSYFYSWAPSGGTGSTASGLGAGNYTVTVTDNNSCTRTATIAVNQPSAINTSTSVVNVSCYGYSNGIVAVSASGGTSPYTYTWSPTGGNSPVATGMSAGTYTVNGRDNTGCAFSRFCVVTQPPAITATTSFTNTTCNDASDGQASVSASGGTPSYIYSWAPSGGSNATATGLSIGIYTCTIEDVRSCQLTKTVSVSGPTAISTSTSVTNVACNGGNNGVASVSTSGGTGGYTYSWAPSGGTSATATGLAQGNYTVTITDANNCQKTAIANITQPTAIGTSTSVTNVSCNGGNNGVASVSASGGAGGYTYSWAPSGGTASIATSLAQGNYTVTITDANGCQKTAITNITQPTAISTSTSVTNVSCNGGNNGAASVSASGGAGGYTYSWAPSGGTSAMATGLAQGNYTVTVTDANGCQKTAIANITQPTAIATSTSVTNVSCNGGSNGMASVSASGGAGGYTYSWAPSGGTSATATGRAQGNYTVTVTDANGCQKTAIANITQPTAISTSTSATNVSCNGGSNGVASVSASGGAGGYSYSWAPSGGIAATAPGLPQGNYTVTVTDANSCAKTAFVSITQPTPLTASSTASSILCNGGTATVTITATGGTLAYTGVGTFTAMAGPHSYTVTDSKGCTATTATLITQPTLLTANASASPILCNGGISTVTVTASNGTPAYSGIGTYTAMSGTQSYTVTDTHGCVATASVSVTEPALLTANASASAILCNGGMSTVTVTAIDGTPAYSGVGTFTTMAGTQSYTVTDANGCVATASVSVTEPTLLTANASASAILCNGGMSTVTVTAVDGTPAYSGVGTFTTMAGTQSYTVTDANGCVATTSVSVTEPALLTANASASAILCNGGVSTVTVTANDGTPAYSGVGTFTMMAGTQSYTVTDANGCIATTGVSVTEPAAITSAQSFTLCQGQSVAVATNTYSSAGTFTDVIASLINGCDSTITTDVVINTLPTITVNSGAICAGNSFTIVPTGADTYTISGGNDVVSPIADATYSVSGTDANGCVSAVDAVSSVSVNALPSLAASSTSTLLCAGETATLSVSGADTYTWSTSETAADIVVSPVITTTYTVDGTDANGCTNSMTVVQDVSACTGINALAASTINVVVYPNPTNGLLTVELAETAKINVMNSIGEIILSETMEAGKHSLDLQQQANGIYVVTITVSSKQQSVKVIKH